MINKGRNHNIRYDCWREWRKVFAFAMITGGVSLMVQKCYDYMFFSGDPATITGMVLRVEAVCTPNTFPPSCPPPPGSVKIG